MATVVIHHRLYLPRRVVSRSLGHGRRFLRPALFRDHSRHDELLLHVGQLRRPGFCRRGLRSHRKLRLSTLDPIRGACARDTLEYPSD